METYNTFKTLADLYEGETTDLSLVENYKDITQKPLILAYVYCTNYRMFYNATVNYFGLGLDDIDSFIVEEIDKALNNFNAERGVKLTTLICTFIKNRLRAETLLLQKASKRPLNNYVDMDSLGEEAYMDNFNELFTLDYLKQLNLSENELEYCKIILADNHELRDAEIARIMGKTRAGIKYIKNKIRQKLIKSGPI